MTKSHSPADDSPLYAAQRQREAAKKLHERQASNDAGQSPDAVDEASDESFPASDPPAWTETTASKDDLEKQ